MSENTDAPVLTEPKKRGRKKSVPSAENVTVRKSTGRKAASAPSVQNAQILNSVQPVAPAKTLASAEVTVAPVKRRGRPRKNNAAEPSSTVSLNEAPVIKISAHAAAEAAPESLPANDAEALRPQNTPKQEKSDIPAMEYGGECCGILDIMNDGYGFLRSTQFKIDNVGDDTRDVYVSITQIRRFSLRSGDMVRGKTRPNKEGERYRALLYITEINGEIPAASGKRPRFEDLVPIYPTQRLRLESSESSRDIALRLIDLISPIGRGQRGLIVAPPKAGKTILLKKLANAISRNYPEVELIVLLIDERPEEVTDMQRSIKGDVIFSTFDELPENHCKIAELVLERAKRLVEHGRDVVILLDSITRLARAYNLTVPPTGRTLSGGLDPGALHKPKRFLGAARNIENGGSLTIIATALVETGSRMDEVVFEEFKGTGNMEIRLDRKLQEKRVFPAIDLAKSGTRREELLLTQPELEGVWSIRKLLGTNEENATEQLITTMMKTETNELFLQRVKAWLALLEKEGYQMR